MDFIFIIAILIMSVVVHEVSHGYAALALGDPTAKYEGRLTLNPIKHLDMVGSIIVPLLGYFFGGFVIGWAKPVPFNPYNLRSRRWGEALVAIAGPLSNISIAIVFALFIRITSTSGFGSSFMPLVNYLVLINIVLAIFNLVPIPPLDGSKIIFALFPQQLIGLRRAIESYGLILVFIFIFFLWQFLAPLAYSIFTLLTGHVAF